MPATLEQPKIVQPRSPQRSWARRWWLLAALLLGVILIGVMTIAGCFLCLCLAELEQDPGAVAVSGRLVEGVGDGLLQSHRLAGGSCGFFSARAWHSPRRRDTLRS